MNKKIFLTLLILSAPLLSACQAAPDNTPRASIGSDNAPILVEEFSDLQCPACAVISPQLEEVISENSTIARLEYYHFPLTQHQYAFQAAEASECANEQGKFWEYIEKAFENQSRLDEDTLKQFAADLNLDTTAFNECLDSGRKKAWVRSDLAEGRRRQLQYTPSIYVNGELVQWAGPEVFEEYLKSLAKQN